jgi:hypothetical protein
MAKITVSISDELRLRMDKRGDLNWSRIARDAFNQAMRDTPDPKMPIDPFANKVVKLKRT